MTAAVVELRMVSVSRKLADGFDSLKHHHVMQIVDTGLCGRASEVRRCPNVLGEHFDLDVSSALVSSRTSCSP